MTSMYGEREALVFRSADGVTRWTYADLWERAIEVARAFRASGVGKDTRVGVLMTNRPEWISAFVRHLARRRRGRHAQHILDAAELEYLLNASSVSVLLFEREVLKKDFAAILSELAPEIGKSARGALQSARFPFLRHLATIGDAPSGIDTWDDFLARGHDEPRELIRGDGRGGAPKRRRSAVLLVGLDEQTKRHPQCASRCRHPNVALPKSVWVRAGRHIRCWSANGFFWSGNFAMSLGATLASGGCLVLQPTFEAAEALSLMDAERVNYPFAWPHQWAQVEAAPNWLTVDLSSMRFADVNHADRAPPHGDHRMVRCPIMPTATPKHSRSQPLFELDTPS